MSHYERQPKPWAQFKLRPSKEAGDALAEAVTVMVQPPLLLMLEGERESR